MGKSKAKGEEAKPKKDKSALPPHLATQHDYVICGPEANAHVRVCCERGMRVCVCASGVVGDPCSCSLASLEDARQSH